MILQNWGLSQGLYPVKFRVAALSPFDDDMRIRVNGVTVEDTLLNVSFYTGSIILPSGTLNNNWQTNGFREIEISASQAISKGASWGFGATIQVDSSNTGDGTQTLPGQWRSGEWTASVHFSDGRIVYKNGGKNDPGAVETASLISPVYHENGAFLLDFETPVSYPDLVIYSFDSSSLNPTYVIQDFSGSRFITGSASMITSFHTGSIVNIGNATSVIPLINIRGYSPTASANIYVGCNLTNNSGRTYEIKSCEFDMSSGGSSVLLDVYYSMDNFATSSSIFQMPSMEITQIMRYVAPITSSLLDGQTIGVRFFPRSVSGTTGFYRMDNLKIKGNKISFCQI